MENKTADIFKAIAFIIFIFGGMASLILFSMENMRLISLYTLLAAFFSGMFHYAIGEALQLLSDIKYNTLAKTAAQDNPQIENDDLPEL